MFTYILSFTCNFREFTDLLTLSPVRSLLISGLISADNKLRRGLRKEALGQQILRSKWMWRTQLSKGKVWKVREGTLMLLRN